MSYFFKKRNLAKINLKKHFKQFLINRSDLIDFRKIQKRKRSKEKLILINFVNLFNFKMRNIKVYANFIMLKAIITIFMMMIQSTIKSANFFQKSLNPNLSKNQIKTQKQSPFLWMQHLKRQQHRNFFLQKQQMQNLK